MGRAVARAVQWCAVTVAVVVPELTNDFFMEVAEMVLVDRIVEGAELDAVVSANEEGAFKLTKALLSDGFRRIAFVGGDLTASSARERLSGYARALAEAGIIPKPRPWLTSRWTCCRPPWRSLPGLLESRLRTAGR